MISKKILTTASLRRNSLQQFGESSTFVEKNKQRISESMSYTLNFNIEYYTEWGEELRVRLKTKGCIDKTINQQEIHLSTDDGRLWKGFLTLSRNGKNDKNDTKGYKNDITEVEYLYAMYRDGQLVWTEWEIAPHRLHLQENISRYDIWDRWRPIPENLPLFSSAYTECMGPDEDYSREQPGNAHYPATLQLRTVEPRLRKGEHLAVCGSSTQLGEWRIAQRMNLTALQEWAIDLDSTMLYNQAEYKFVVTDDYGNIIRWETGENRTLRTPQTPMGSMLVMTVTSPEMDIPNWKVAGVVIPVFSLRSGGSYGVGDFGDLKTFICWAAKNSMHAIQILPINDTVMNGTWQDSYPYNAISIYAFHPLYCDLRQLPVLNDKLQMEKFMMAQQKLNSLPDMDYEKVFERKMRYLRLVYEQERERTFASADYQTFFEQNCDWLIPYAAFCYLRDQNGHAYFPVWKTHSHYNRSSIEKMCKPDSPDYIGIALYYYIQYQLHLQLSEVRRTARAAGIIIKGDIPIGISRDSVEAWTEPSLFNIDAQAGAPPDAFSTNGQNWGFPTYNWDAMAADGYRWWIRRFQKMSEYFDAYRIDHVLGFFRIWDIPTHSVHGLLGQFSPSLPMSIKEIESYGLHFDVEQMTRPYITDKSIEEIFGYKKELITLLYLNHSGDGTYELKPEYSTQRKIQERFAGKESEDDIQVREGLYSLASCVLFIRDRRHPELFHPRIAAQTDYAYKALDDYQKKAFNMLYDDYYYRRHNQFWYEEAMKKLPILTQCTRMLVCAEDLGMVPECVSWVMERLRIISLEIQTMPKQQGLRFSRLQDNPYRSVATISTHDMAPLRQWWDEDWQRAQDFYNEALLNDGPAPHPAPGWLCEDIVARHLFSPSILCLLSLQDWLSIDDRMRFADPNGERINIPSNPRHYWRWRMHISIEQLMHADKLNEKITSLIKNSGRA